jgi:hypothetical protein
MVWCLVDSLEQTGEMAAEDAVRWKHGIFGLMERWGLEAEDLASGNSDTAIAESSAVSV